MELTEEAKARVGVGQPKSENVGLGFFTFLVFWRVPDVG
jgi:hypothetical protein